MKPTKYVHLRLKSPSKTGCGALTLAINQDDSTFGFAFCSPKDQFNRRLGRGFALWRLSDKLPIATRSRTAKGLSWEALVNECVYGAMTRGPRWTHRYFLVESWRKPKPKPTKLSVWWQRVKRWL